MDGYHTSYILISLLIAAFNAVLTYAVYQRRSTLGRIPLTGVLLATVWWLFGFALQITSQDAARQLFWARVQYLGAAVLPTLWLFYSLQYSCITPWVLRRCINWRYLPLFAIEPIFSLLLVWTARHPALPGSSDALTGGLFTALVQPTGLWDWLHILYTTLLCLLSAILLVGSLINRRRAYRSQTRVAVAGALIATAGLLLETLGTNPILPLPLIPLSVALAGLLVSLAFIGYRLWGIGPQAYHTVFEHINDSVIVLDPSNRIVDLNQNAVKLIGLDQSRLIGQRVDKAWPDWPNEITLPLKKRIVDQEISFACRGVVHTFDIHITPLTNPNNQIRGRVVVLRDKTEQMHTKEALQRRDKILDAIGFATKQFMRPATLEEILPEVFARLGEATLVSRVYLLENQTGADGSLACIYRHEWNGWRIQAYQSIPVLQVFSMIERGLGRWVELLSTGKVVHEHLHTLPESEQLFLQERGVRSLVVVPIFLEEKWWGSLGFEDCKTEREWTSLEIDVLRTAADTIGGALQRRQAEESVQRWAEVIQTLLDLTVVIGSTLNIPQVLDRVILAVRTLLPVDRAAVLLWDEQQNALLPSHSAASDPGHSDWPADAVQAFSQFKLTPEFVPLIHELQRRNEAIAIRSVPNSPLLPAQLASLFNITSLLAVPINYHDRFMGALYLDYTRAEHLFTRQEIDMVTALARQAGLAIDRARLYTQSQEDAEELAALYQASSTLLTTRNDLPELAKQIIAVVTGEFEAAHCCVLLVDPEHRLLRPIASHGFQELKELPLTSDSQSLPVHVALSGDIGHTPDGAQDTQYLPVSPRTRAMLAIPLKAGDEVIGVLSLESPQPDAFNERTRRMLTVFADDAALALENVRLFNAAQIHARQMALLNEITHTALLKTDIHDKLNTLANRMNELIYSDCCYITLWQAEQEKALPGGVSEHLSDLFQNWAPESSQLTLTAAVLAAREPIIVPDVQQSGYYLPRLNGSFPFRTLLGLPMIIGEQKLGAVLIGFNQSHTFTNREIAICQQATGQVALAIAEAGSLEAARQAAERRTVLHGVSQEIVTASFDAEQIYTAIHRAAARLMPTEAFVITLFSPDHTQAEAVYLIDKEGRTPAQVYPSDQGLTGKVLAAGRTLYIPDVERAAGLEGLHYGTPQHTRSVLALPLRVGEQMIGMLSVQSYQPNAYTTEDRYLLEMLAATAAIAIENSRLLKEIQWLAITDPLTGLFNRRGLFELTEREVDRYRRFGRPFCVLMLDIDHFKLINDTYGHAAGDQVLVGLADRLKNHIRDIDIIGRYGGEEILVVLPETQLEQAVQAAERARHHVEQQPIHTDRGEIPVTISIGVAQIEASISDLALLVDRADSAMYAAKQAGRNQVRAYTESKTPVSQ